MALLSTILLVSGGCATLQDLGNSSGASREAAAKDSGTAREERPAQPASAKDRLAEGIERYEAGDFVAAIRTLNALEIAQSDVATQVEAGKYLAFSYCVTDRKKLCREAFDRLLAIDPHFVLQPAEAGHPLWGPVFVQARKTANKQAN